MLITIRMDPKLAFTKTRHAIMSITSSSSSLLPLLYLPSPNISLRPASSSWILSHHWDWPDVAGTAWCISNIEPGCFSPHDHYLLSNTYVFPSISIWLLITTHIFSNPVCMSLLTRNYLMKTKFEQKPETLSQ